MKKCLVVICMLFAMPVFAQRVATDYGDIYYEFFQFKEAARYYEEALNDTRIKKKQYLYEQLSQCYKYLFQYVKAEEYFEKLMTSGETVRPEFYIDYGNILKLNGKYKEAKAQFKKFKEVTGTDFADAQLRSVNWAIRTADTIKNYAIAPTDLNISGQSLGYCFYNNGLIYAHARNKKPRGKEMAPLFDLDYVRKISITEFQPEMDILSQIEFDLNEGSPCVSADKQTLYFSANSTNIKKKKGKTIGTIEVSDDGVSNFKIYAAQSEGGLFQDPYPLSFNDNEYNCVHPFIMGDGTTLFFSSDRPGGFGGFDLYKSLLQPNGKWGDPVNLGKSVNTEENELYPWVSENMLYFSSKGFNNYGGYDIYIAKLNRSLMPFDLKNLGKPINSFRDDVAFITNDGGRTGYFSSNRDNDNGDDNVYYYRETGVFHSLDAELKQDTLSDTIFALSAPEQVKITSEPGTTSSIEPVQAPVPANGNPPQVPASITSLPLVVAVVPKGSSPLSPGSGEQKTKQVGSKAIPAGGLVPVIASTTPKVELPVAVKPEGVVSGQPIAKQEVSKALPVAETLPVSASMDPKLGSVKTIKSKRAVQNQPKGNQLTRQEAGSTVSSAGIEHNQQPEVAMPAKDLYNLKFTPVQFAFNKAEITEQQMEAADSLALLIQNNPGAKALVVAHTDSRGSFEYNVELSERRAASVRAYLIKKGVRTSNIITKGLGEMYLLNHCSDSEECTEEQHAINRRVEMKIVK